MKTVCSVSKILLLALGVLRIVTSQEIIIAQFPAEGYDYPSGGLRGIIFDMSERKNGATVFLTEDIEVPRPYNIGNVQPSTKLDLESSSRTFNKVSDLSASNAEHASLSWTLAPSYQGILSTAAGAAGLKLGRNSPSGLAGFEVGFSINDKYQWAQRQLETIDGVIVETHAEYNYAEVFMRPVTEARLTPEFLRAFALLPSGEWSTLSDAQQRLFETFLKTYGTHFVKAAKFGGSYTSRVFAQQCDLVIERQSSKSLESCLSARISVGIGSALGLPELEFGPEICEGYTTDGATSSRWNSSIVESTESWEGGSLDEAPNVRTGDFSGWIRDVEKNPRSVPTQLSSIPDLFRDISGAFSLDDDFCNPCKKLKEAGLTQESLDGKIKNLEEAFVEYLYKSLETKVASEDKCDRVCGSCGTQPSGDCTCPLPDIDSCQIETPDVMDVHISTINFAVDGFGVKGMRLEVSNLGPPYDKNEISGDKRYITYKVDSSFLRQKGDFIHIEAKKPIGNRCVGAVDYPVEKVGTGEILAMPGECGGRWINNLMKKGTNPRVVVNGRVSFPYCCNCTSSESNVWLESEHLLKWWEILLICLGAVIGCCCCCACLGSMAD